MSDFSIDSGAATRVDINPGETQQFQFKGNAREWFGIWIVNLLLSIVTIGIYSAWAKVRRKKYFYNNTYVAGRNFDYHATGKQILIGRLIFIGGYIAFSLAASLNPFLGLVLGLAVLAVLPWLIVKSMQFNARMSSYSNVRFNFVGKTGRAFVVFILLPILAYLAVIAVGVAAAMAAQSFNYVLAGLLGVLGLAVAFVAFPVVDKAVKLFVYNNARLGKAEVSLNISLSPFVRAMAAAVAWIIVVLAVGGVLFGGTVAAFFEPFGPAGNGELSPELVAFIGVIYVFFFLAFLPAAFIYQAIVRNAVFNNANLEGGHEFRSTINPLKLFWIALSNAVVAICTLGLMLPWAQVRMHKYMAAQTFVVPGASLDAFLNDQVEQGMSVADAYTDLEGVDFGVPL